MFKKISVIIPTYREPEYLDLCLKSCIEGATSKDLIEVIVVVDGYFEENEEVLTKWDKDIKVLNLEQNYGLPYATNMGVYKASNEWVLIVNDDNIFPKKWNKSLQRLTINEVNTVYSLNQIEPNPSIFPQFIIKDYGQIAKTFDLTKFWEDNIHQNNMDISGGTLPIFTSKKCFMMVGGWDEHYPSNGVVADWDFFLKCELAGVGLIRDYGATFYHFAQIATGTQRYESEQFGHMYFSHKWGIGYKPKALR